MTKKLSPYQILLKNNEQTESYRVGKSFFETLRQILEPFRSKSAPSKAIRCIETGKIFNNANSVATWLTEQGLTQNYHANTIIKNVCNGKQKRAYGYHWEYAEHE